ncbi:hypothetical protein C8J56DRAFT_1032205 [Mycena floridula]|nr:hypothetical protein C8J56DRAFT_1032205 [Mycena floridula]
MQLQRRNRLTCKEGKEFGWKDSARKAKQGIRKDKRVESMRGRLRDDGREEKESRKIMHENECNGKTVQGDFSFSAMETPLLLPQIPKQTKPCSKPSLVQSQRNRKPKPRTRTGAGGARRGARWFRLGVRRQGFVRGLYWWWFWARRGFASRCETAVGEMKIRDDGAEKVKKDWSLVGQDRDIDDASTKLEQNHGNWSKMTKRATQRKIRYRLDEVTRAKTGDVIGDAGPNSRDGHE